MEKGLTPIRTARTISGVIALVGMLVLLIQRVLSGVLVMAHEMLSLAFARYGNFTGRFAANNFAEDKKLLSLLQQLKDFMPTAESMVTLLMVLSIVLLVVAALGFALTKQFTHVLVAIKLLKWVPEGETAESAEPPMSPKTKRILTVVAGSVVLLVIAAFGIHSCTEHFEARNMQLVREELDGTAVMYIQAQRAYFNKKKAVGTDKQLGLVSIPSGKYFSFTARKSSLLVESLADIGKCPAGSRWEVHANISGFLSKDLKFFCLMPKNPECLKVAPDFKNLVRQR